ncbi:MAG TPA: glycosyltransferase family 4 protein [Solirubrobacteraceae bacterium]|jgi:glycosyltransferase involved in cell wall biosynthesis|nr:glycosyltransferase family 4 protein [Solirubrobacteraceae bacterium]
MSEDAPRSVLILTPRWTRDGGVATHAMTSAEALARAGLRVTAAAARIDERAEIPGVALHHSPRLFDASASPEQRLAGALSSEPQLIHLHQFEEPETVEFMRASAPVVISMHGYTAACASGVHYFRPGQECGRAHGPGCVPNLLLRGCAHTRDPRWLPASYRRAGEHLRALLAADLVLSYSSAIDRHLAVNGVQRRGVIPLFTTMVPRPGSGHETRRRVVFAGRVVAPKGVEVLIRAAREVDARFVICGEGRRLAATRKLAARLGVAERVEFPGWLGVEQLAGELGEASVVAVPSLWPEPFSLVGIEALAAGRPVVASETGGIRDWLEPGVNGLGVKPGDVSALAAALNELLADPDRQAQMGRAGQQMVAARFSRERHVEALIEAYRTARATWRDSSAAGTPASETAATR